jgi:transglutaminase-like putative cysteine protease
MKLKANCTMTVKAGADCPVIAMLRPRSGMAQWMISERYELDPWVRTTEYVDNYGNLGQRLTIPRGEMRIEVEMVMETEDSIRVTPGAPCTPIAALPDDALLYLLQSRYCPSDKMEAKALEIVGQAKPGYDQIETIRAWIHDHIDYRYGVSNGTTDALDSLEHGAGVCRDFSHIGVALTRALKIPARMVVGYLYKPTRWTCTPGSRPSSTGAGTPSTPPSPSRAAGASWWLTAGTRPTWPSCRTTARWRWAR